MRRPNFWKCLYYAIVHGAEWCEYCEKFESQWAWTEKQKKEHWEKIIARTTLSPSDPIHNIGG